MSGLFKALFGVVVMVVVTMVLIAIFNSIAKVSKDEAERASCKASVMAYAKFNSLNLDVPFVTGAKADESSINCPTKYLTIQSAKASSMRRDISDLMVECWDNFGAGKVNLFSSDDAKFCVICSVFQFEDKTTQLQGLPYFMMSENMPLKVDGIRPTYQEYLTGVTTNPEVIDDVRGKDLSYIDGSKRYAIMFTFYKESYWSKVYSSLVGALTGVAAGAVLVIGVAAGLAIAGASFGIAAPVSALIVTASAAAGAAIGVSSADEGAGTFIGGADWDANIIMVEYDTQKIQDLGCEALPISQKDPRFK